MTNEQLKKFYSNRLGKSYDKRCAAKDEFIESNHPRDSDGKFGSGSSKSPEHKNDDVVTVKTATRHPFVTHFVQTHTTIKAQKEYLQTVPKEKLHTALKLAENHIDPASLHVKQLISKELDERAANGR